MRLAAGITFAALLGACATSEPNLPPTASSAEAGPPTEISIVGNAGAEIGRASFAPAPQGVLIRVLVPAGGLSPGWHGAHLHMVGDCSDPAKFDHAGGYIQKNATYHGLLYEHGPESGDLPSISVAGDGSASAELFTGLITMSELQDADGSALIIHVQPDDHVGQPIGNAGDRVGCAVIKS